ncbi:hypothetical protein I4U23_023154 [Adineta vaga]|nr:hypothetical protein I4U23_023154 [Adineta vaga]
MKLILIIICALILKNSNGIINPNLKSNWRWIVYPRTRAVSVDTQSDEKEQSYVRRNHIQVSERSKTNGYHHHSKAKPYEFDEENSKKPFNHSLYQGWYQNPTSLAVNNTLSFGGPWGDVHQINDDDEVIDTCEISNISICNNDNNVPGEIRQCFHQIDEIKSYASDLFDVSNEKIEILKEDEKLAQLPFPETFNVTILEVSQITGCNGNPIVCHSMKTNASDCNTLYLCHAVKGTIVKQVIVDYNEEINDIKMYAMCHLDTHNFGKEHVAFRMLHKRPGDDLFGFRPTSSKATAPDNDLARPMYYLSCVLSVIDYNDQDMRKYRNHHNWSYLMEEDKRVLFYFIKYLSPDLFENQVFFNVEQLSGDSENKFYEFGQVRHELLAVQSI